METATVIDYHPAVYANLANNVDEPGRRTFPDGYVEYTFTNVGELRALPDGSSEELVMLPTDPPICWAWQWRPVK